MNGSRRRAVLKTAVLALTVGSLIFVVVVSTIGADLMLIEIADGLFLFWAVVWALLQAFGWVRLPMRRVVMIGVGFIVAGAISFAVYYGVSAVDGLPLIGYTLAYVGAGWLVEALRRDRRLSGRRGWLIVIAGLVVLAVAVVGVWQFHGHDIKGFLWLGVIAVLAILPIGVNVLTEDALDLVSGWTTATRTVIIALAVLPLLGLVVASGVVAHSWLAMLVVVLALVVLFTALVSNSHLDIALIIAVLVLVAAAPPESGLPDHLAPGQGSSSLLALGDSYMAGEGADRFFTGTDDGEMNECRRSPSAYAVLVSEPKQPFDNTTLLACSGASTANVISRDDDSGAHPQWDEGATQVDQVAELQKANPSWQPKLVLISVGGNDAGFSTLGKTCLAPGHCDHEQAVFLDNLPRVRKALDATYASLRRQLPGVPIVAVPYPQPIAKADACNGLPLTGSERAFVTNFVHRLDATIWSAADAAGLYYLDTMEQALANEHLQLCDRAAKAGPGINKVSLNSVSGLSAQRYNPAKWIHDSLHPNDKGYAAMRDAFLNWYASHPSLAPPPGPAGPPSTASAPTSQPEPPCDMSGSGSASCQTVTRRWAVGQTLALWPWGIGVLITLVAAWLLAVSALSFLPRPWTATSNVADRDRSSSTA